jgi:hypothetical protein
VNIGIETALHWFITATAITATTADSAIVNKLFEQQP